MTAQGKAAPGLWFASRLLRPVPQTGRALSAFSWRKYPDLPVPEARPFAGQSLAGSVAAQLEIKGAEHSINGGFQHIVARQQHVETL